MRPSRPRLSNRSKLTLLAARQLAARAGGGEPSTAHLLMALLDRPSPEVQDLLDAAGASAAELRTRLFVAYGRGIPGASVADARALDAIMTRAREEATTNGRAAVDDIHVFLAALHDPATGAAAVMRGAGIDHGWARAEQARLDLARQNDLALGPLTLQDGRSDRPGIVPMPQRSGWRERFTLHARERRA